MEKIWLLGQVSDVKNKTRVIIADVTESFEENPGLSIQQTSLHRFLHKDLGLNANKVQLTQQLKPADHQQRRGFAVWALEMHENYPELYRPASSTSKADPSEAQKPKSYC